MVMIRVVPMFAIYNQGPVSGNLLETDMRMIEVGSGIPMLRSDLVVEVVTGSDWPLSDKWRPIAERSGALAKAMPMLRKVSIGIFLWLVRFPTIVRLASTTLL